MGDAYERELELIQKYTEAIEIIQNDINELASRKKTSKGFHRIHSSIAKSIAWVMFQNLKRYIKGETDKLERKWL